MASLFDAIDRQFARSAAFPSGLKLSDLQRDFPPEVPGSLRSLLTKMAEGATRVSVPGGHPHYQRPRTEPQDVSQFTTDGTYISLASAVVPSYPPTHVPLSVYNDLFAKRAAAAVSAAVGPPETVIPSPQNVIGDVKEALQEMKQYGSLSEASLQLVAIPKAKCLAAMAYHDYFPSTPTQFLRRMVQRVVLSSNPGWCGTCGPTNDGFFDPVDDVPEGNYDLSQMHLLALAYRYYDELSDDAREFLVVDLLGQGRISRPHLDDIVTGGGLPNDWSRAGFVSIFGFRFRIGETENHILAMLTARYLTNQLLYQRDHDHVHDNRRNGEEDAPNCTDLVLLLLRRILVDDFSEYNAKPYQHETRTALLNLYSYAYDHEVRLAARMVLDYISAHIAVSSNDLRRMVPFRRRNEPDRSAQLDGVNTGFMNVGLLEWFRGADPMVEHYAMQTGQTRAFEFPGARRKLPWTIASGGDDAVSEVMSDYRIPNLIHDLFVHDPSRRVYQRLHRFAIDDVGGGRNADNMEIFAGSPSYLITAGGSPAGHAIPIGEAGRLPSVVRKNEKQLGVAVTTSFIPTGRAAGHEAYSDASSPLVANDSASEVIQFGSFSQKRASNYGVAPDFACGRRVYLPAWVTADHPSQSAFRFIDRGSSRPGAVGLAGFYLAIFDNAVGALLEAFDTWLHPDVTFAQFVEHVRRDNGNLVVQTGVPSRYVTYNGNQLTFTIDETGAEVRNVIYGPGDPQDALGDAGNVESPFLNGAVLNSTSEAVVEISNPSLGKTLILDMSDPAHPRRTSEDGVVETAGFNNEVWVDFAWTGPQAGDFFHPFSTVAAALAGVADFGVIRIVPGTTSERPLFGNSKCTLVAPLGGVRFGVR